MSTNDGVEDIVKTSSSQPVYPGWQGAYLPPVFSCNGFHFQIPITFVIDEKGIMITW